MTKKQCIILIPLLLAAMVMLSIGFYMVYRMYMYNKCWNNAFIPSYCEKYKTY